MKRENKCKSCGTVSHNRLFLCPNCHNPKYIKKDYNKRIKLITTKDN